MGDDLHVTQEITCFSQISYTVGPGNNLVTNFRAWNGLSDTHITDRFLQGELSAARFVFNKYKLAKVQYVFFINHVGVTGGTWNPGIVIL